MKRLVMAVSAIVFAVLGIQSGTAEARAEVPVWPTCLRAAVAGGDVRIWFNPGNLYATPTRVVEGRQGDDKTRLTRRRDGVWVATVARTLDSTYYFNMRSTDGLNGAWVKCKKINP